MSASASVVVVAGSVIPDLVPKAELALAPAGEVNVSYAPDVPPVSSRTEQAIVEVHFDIVEGVQAIDPNGTEYETWGYRLHGDTSVSRLGMDTYGSRSLTVGAMAVLKAAE